MLIEIITVKEVLVWLPTFALITVAVNSRPPPLDD
jgi:hypothetical protein